MLLLLSHSVIWRQSSEQRQSPCLCWFCGLHIRTLIKSYAAHWQTLSLLKLLCNCYMHQLKCALLRRSHLYWITFHSFQMVLSCIKWNPVSVISEPVWVHECMHYSRSWPDEPKSSRHKLSNSGIAFRGFMKASWHMIPVLMFEFYVVYYANVAPGMWYGMRAKGVPLWITSTHKHHW